MSKHIPSIQISLDSKIAERNDTQTNPTSQKTTLPLADEKFVSSEHVVATNSSFLKGAVDQSSTTDVTPVVAPKATKHAGTFNPVVTGISPFLPGLLLVSVSSTLILALVRNALTCLALEKSRELGIPMPVDVESLLSVYSGNPRDLQQAMFFAGAFPPATNNMSCDIKICPSQDKLDWTSYGGQYAFMPIIEEAKGWVIVEQTMVGPITPAVSQGLIRVGNAAKKAGVLVMLLLVCTGEKEASQLIHVCDDYIEVSPCEPDIGVDSAFSIDCVGIRNLNSLGIGKTMCSVRLTNGVFQRRYDSFISGDHETRIMWHLRGQGKTLEEIGSLLKINRSTVLRRLQGLPVQRHVDMGQDWLGRNLESSPPTPSA